LKFPSRNSNVSRFYRNSPVVRLSGGYIIKMRMIDCHSIVVLPDSDSNTDSDRSIMSYYMMMAMPSCRKFDKRIDPPLGQIDLIRWHDMGPCYPIYTARLMSYKQLPATRLRRRCYAFGGRRLLPRRVCCECVTWASYY
jgi:hypothetical protein